MNKEKVINSALKFNDRILKILNDITIGKRLKDNNYLARLDAISLAELIRFCMLVQNEQFKKAQNVLEYMDTDIYESIPDALFEAIDGYNRDDE